MLLPDYAIIEKANLQVFSSIEKEQIKEYTNVDLRTYVNYLELGIFEYNQKINYKIKNAILCYDDLNNPYIYAEFNPIGYMLVSLINNEPIIINPLANNTSQFFYSKSRKYIFDFKTLKLNESPTLQYTKNNIDDSFTKSLKDDTDSVARISNIVSNKELIEKKLKLQYIDKGEDIKPTDKIVYADKEIPYSWWFKQLVNNFGYADESYIWPERYGYGKDKQEPEGLCQYVGLGIILQYMEYFVTGGIFSQTQIEKYMQLSKEISNLNTKWNLPQGPIINKWLVGDLWRKHGKDARVTTSLYLKWVLQSFLNEGYHAKPSYIIQRRDAGWIWPWKWVNDSKPTMVMIRVGYMSIHGIMVYGYYYKTHNYLVHYGWDNTTQVIVSNKIKTRSSLLISMSINPEIKPQELKKYFLFNDEYITGPEYGEKIKS